MAQVEVVEGERDEESDVEKQSVRERSKGARTGVDSAGYKRARGRTMYSNDGQSSVMYRKQSRRDGGVESPKYSSTRQRPSRNLFGP